MGRTILLACLLVLVNQCFVEAQLVKLSQGYVAPTVKSSRDNNPFYAYLGIPYAEPPVGKLRFRESIPHKGWEGVKNATKEAPICVQDVPSKELKGQDPGQEDCLYLNVYVPSIKSEETLPVIVFIHGGGFISGNARSDNYGVEYYMDEPVVVVTIQYRLGPFGFLSFGNKQIPGNFGLKDQVLALKWVQKNIKKFGGNPDKVAVYGQQAGAFATALHIVSPLSNGLFHAQYLDSGVASNPKFLLPADLAVSRANKLASLVGCSTENADDLLKCLQKVPAKKIVETKRDFYSFDKNPITRFAAVIESSESKNNFLPAQPDEIKGKPIPLLVGLDYKDGAYYAAAYCDRNYRKAKKLNQNLTKNLPIVLSSNWLKPGANKTFVKELKSFYLQNQKVGPDNFDGFIDMITDLTVGFPAINLTHYHMNFGDVYFYLYNYTLPVTLASTMGNCSRYLGPSNGDELLMFFKRPAITAYELSPEEEKMSKELVKTGVGFAKNGVPGSPDWKPTKDQDDIDYFYIGRDFLGMKHGLFTERIKFINEVISPLFTSRVI